MTEDINGKKQTKEPTKKEYRIAFMQQKAETARAIEHLQMLGPMNQNMMIACFEVLKLAKGHLKDMDLVIGFGPDEVHQTRLLLEKICDTVLDFAAQWRATMDPNWNPSKMAMDKGAVQDLVLDVDMEALKNLKPTVKCSSCDWDGFMRDAPPGSDCPVCGEKVEEIFSEQAENSGAGDGSN